MISLLKQYWRLLACFVSGLVLTVGMSFKMPVQQPQTAINPIYPQVATQEYQASVPPLSPFEADHMEHNFYQ